MTQMKFLVQSAIKFVMYLFANKNYVKKFAADKI